MEGRIYGIGNRIRLPTAGFGSLFESRFCVDKGQGLRVLPRGAWALSICTIGAATSRPATAAFSSTAGACTSTWATSNYATPECTGLFDLVAADRGR